MSLVIDEGLVRGVLLVFLSNLKMAMIHIRITDLRPQEKKQESRTFKHAIKFDWLYARI